MEVVVITGATSCAKLQSNHHHQQTNIQFFTGRMPYCPSCHPTNSVKALKGKICTTDSYLYETFLVLLFFLFLLAVIWLIKMNKISHSVDLLTPSSPGVFQLCLWPLIAPGYLGKGLPCLSSALWLLGYYWTETTDNEIMHSTWIFHQPWTWSWKQLGEIRRTQ